MSALPPREPSADLRQAASALHQLFTALMNEGFTEPQALAILGHSLAAASDGKGGKA